MYQFLTKSSDTQKLYFEQTATNSNLPIQIVEKDFWVCLSLDILFKLETIGDQLTFKGGTSLSKVYGLIDRFSEDIDVSIDKEFLGFLGERNPSNAASGKKAKALIKELGEVCSNFVVNDFFEALKSEFEKLLPIGEFNWRLEIDPEDPDKQTILFFYPSVGTITNEYVRPAVKIELGARADHWPVSTREVISYVAESYPDSFSDLKVEIRVLNAERTFWEKATILHMFANFPNEKPVPSRQSRHYYDFFCLLNSEVKAIAEEDIDLLEKVQKHKSVYFKSGWADYASAKKGSLKLIPSDRVLDVIKKDYSDMGVMFYSDVPSWDEIESTIRGFEEAFNES